MHREQEVPYPPSTVSYCGVYIKLDTATTSGRCPLNSIYRPPRDILLEHDQRSHGADNVQSAPTHHLTLLSSDVGLQGLMQSIVGRMASVMRDCVVKTGVREGLA